MLRLLCLALLLPGCGSTTCLSADFEEAPPGAFAWTPDDIGWAHSELPGDPDGDVVKIDPIDATQIAAIEPGPLPTRAVRITAPGVASPVSLRAVPAGAPLTSGTITVSFSGRFEAPTAGFSPEASWLLVATDSNDVIVGGLVLSAGGSTLAWGGSDFTFDPDARVDPTLPFTLTAVIRPAERYVALTVVSDGITLVEDEVVEIPADGVGDVAALVFWGTEGALVLDDVQVSQD
jgi:hypothetical protein